MIPAKPDPRVWRTSIGFLEAWQGQKNVADNKKRPSR